MMTLYVHTSRVVRDAGPRIPAKGREEKASDLYALYFRMHLFSVSLFSSGHNNEIP